MMDYLLKVENWEKSVKSTGELKFKKTKWLCAEASCAGSRMLNCECTCFASCSRNKRKGLSTDWCRAQKHSLNQEREGRRKGRKEKRWRGIQKCVRCGRPWWCGEMGESNATFELIWVTRTNERFVRQRERWETDERVWEIDRRLKQDDCDDDHYVGRKDARKYLPAKLVSMDELIVTIDKTISVEMWQLKIDSWTMNSISQRSKWRRWSRRRRATTITQKKNNQLRMITKIRQWNKWSSVFWVTRWINNNRLRFWCKDDSKRMTILNYQLLHESKNSKRTSWKRKDVAMKVMMKKHSDDNDLLSYEKS